MCHFNSTESIQSCSCFGALNTFYVRSGPKTDKYKTRGLTYRSQMARIHGICTSFPHPSRAQMARIPHTWHMHPFSTPTPTSLHYTPRLNRNSQIAADKLEHCLYLTGQEIRAFRESETTYSVAGQYTNIILRVSV